jgi:hypothetical protein
MLRAGEDDLADSPLTDARVPLAVAEAHVRIVREPRAMCNLQKSGATLGTDRDAWRGVQGGVHARCLGRAEGC